MSLQDKRVHKIKCHYGLPDYYEHYANNAKNPVSRKVYMNIIKDYLKEISIEISQNAYPFTLPQKLGRIELRKTKRGVSIDKNGNIKNTLNTNWKATNELWKNDERAKNEKIRIRYTNEHTDGFVFKLIYLKSKANFKNKFIYKFSLNRAMRRSTSKSIINHKVDAFLINN